MIRATKLLRVSYVNSLEGRYFEDMQCTIEQFFQGLSVFSTKAINALEKRKPLFIVTPIYTYY